MLSETRQALERAADLLMDHGVIRTGAELERVCDQIRNLACKRTIEVGIHNSVIMQQNAPRDFVVGELRAKGIPATPSQHADPRDFGSGVRVSSGRLTYVYELARDYHRFVWLDMP